jgi:hypothetical protein
MSFKELNDRLRLELNYSFGGHDFCEEIDFIGANSKKIEVANLTLPHLHAISGISYYKAFGFQKFKAGINKDSANFFQNVYRQGLGEFAYLNQIHNFESIVAEPIENSEFPQSTLNENNLVCPIGGGKDSLLTALLLKEKYPNLRLIAVTRPGQEKFYQDFANKLSLPLILIQRRIDPKIIELNQQGALNGHVPFSAILAFIFLTAAPLYGFNQVALSNERSANSENLIWNGREINHQYSKTFDFEKEFYRYSRKIFSDFNYFSFLRPVSELWITKTLSRFKDYDSNFTSCNKYFANKSTQLWCGRCPKCLFFFILAAPFFSVERLINIFGRNLLNQSDLWPLATELLGQQKHKPFECVGEYYEVQAAFFLLSKLPAWKDTTLVKQFQAEILTKLENPESLVKKALTLQDQHNLNPEFMELIYAAQ